MQSNLAMIQAAKRDIDFMSGDHWPKIGHTVNIRRPLHFRGTHGDGGPTKS